MIGHSEKYKKVTCERNCFNAHTHGPCIGVSRKLNMTVFSFAWINNIVRRPPRPDPGCSWPRAQIGPWYNGQYPPSGHIRAYPGVCCKANVSAKCPRRKRWVTLQVRTSSRATRFSNYASVCMFLTLVLSNVANVRLSSLFLQTFYHHRYFIAIKWWH